jgi:type II secretory ATPase GspE/PulE/Tfp pilus assembly ATPase PilB-like protein
MLDDATSLGWVSPLADEAPTLLTGEPRLLAWSSTPRVDPGKIVIDRQLLQKLPGPLLRLHRALPLALQDGTLLLGLEDPEDLAIQETVSRLSGWQVKVVQLSADGGEIPPWDQIPSFPADSRPGQFELLDGQLQVQITGSLVWVRFSQSFANPGEEPLEGSYQIPIPHDALIQRVEIELDGSSLPAGRLERVHLTGQLHLRTLLTPVPAKARGRIHIEYVHLIERQPDGFRLALPSPPTTHGLDCGIALHWPGLQPDQLSCSRRATWVRQHSDQLQLRIQPDEQLRPRPLVLQYRAPKFEKTLQGLLLSDGQHFLLQLQAPPPTLPAPRNVLFLLDRSASLEGWAAQQGRRAVVHALRQLRPLDRFALALFDEGVLPWQTGRWVGAGSTAAAEEWLQLQGPSQRTTDLVQSLEWVRHFFRDQDDMYLVVLSDGIVGRQAEAMRLASSLAKSMRVFSLSLGAHSQQHFLRRLAEIGGGSSEQLLAQNLNSRVERLMQQLGPSVLSNVQLVGQGFHCDPAQQYPERLSEIFSGQQLTVVGKHQGIGPLTARGLGSQGPMSLTLMPKMVEHPALAALWAQAQREGLLRRLGPAREIDRNRLVEQLNQLNRTYPWDRTGENVRLRQDFWQKSEVATRTSTSERQLAEDVLEQALRRQASHIHLELQNWQLKVRLRVCGRLLVLPLLLEDRQALGLLAQFRQWCGLEAEQGNFQTGRFQRQSQNESYRFEASFCPTVNGEKVVLEIRPARLVSHSSLAEPARSAVASLFRRKRGLILVCGPKSSGGNSLMVDWLGTQFADRSALLCHKEEWFGLDAATQVTAQQDLSSLLLELEGHDIDVLACTSARQRSSWESLLRRAGERSLVLARHHAPQAGAAMAELLEQGIDGRTLGKVILGALSLRRLPQLCGCKTPELDQEVLSALPAGGDYARKVGCSLCQGEGTHGQILCAEVLLYRSEIFSVLKPGVPAERLEQAFIRYPMSQQLLRLAQQGLIEARHCLSPNSTF